MKSSALFSLALLARKVTSTGTPKLQWDPATAKDCLEWYNNYEGETCEAVRSYYHITPEQFHAWNPSVGLDCQPWNFQSYCIVTQERLDKTPPTKTSTKAAITSMMSTTTLGPSPTAWESLGCYAEDTKLPTLEKNMNPAGDEALTIPKCKDSFYKQSFDFPGVQHGNQCWCSSYVGGEWAKNQTSCDIPCTGDKSTPCGGDGFLSVFKAQENQGVVFSSSSSSTAATTIVFSSTKPSTSTKATSSSSTRTRYVNPSALEQYLSVVAL